MAEKLKQTKEQIREIIDKNANDPNIKRLDQLCRESPTIDFGPPKSGKVPRRKILGESSQHEEDQVANGLRRTGLES